MSKTGKEHINSLKDGREVFIIGKKCGYPRIFMILLCEG